MTRVSEVAELRISAVNDSRKEIDQYIKDQRRMMAESRKASAVIAASNAAVRKRGEMLRNVSNILRATFPVWKMAGNVFRGARAGINKFIQKLNPLPGILSMIRGQVRETSDRFGKFIQSVSPIGGVSDAIKDKIKVLAAVISEFGGKNSEAKAKVKAFATQGMNAVLSAALAVAPAVAEVAARVLELGYGAASMIQQILAAKAGARKNLAIALGKDEDIGKFATMEREADTAATTFAGKMVSAGNDARDAWEAFEGTLENVVKRLKDASLADVTKGGKILEGFGTKPRRGRKKREVFGPTRADMERLQAADEARQGKLNKEGAKFGPTRSMFEADQAKSNAEGAKFGPDRGDMNRLQDAEAERQKAKRKEDADAARAQMEEFAGRSRRVAAGIGAAFAAVATGQMEVADVLKQVWMDTMGAILDMIFEVATQQVLAAVAPAMAESYKSQAGIPVIGPILAMGAMGIAQGVIMGLLSSIPSRQLGGPITSTGPIFGHEGEVVLSRPIVRDIERTRMGSPARGLTDPIERARGDAGGGGRNVTINVSSMVPHSKSMWVRNIRDNLLPVLREAGV